MNEKDRKKREVKVATREELLGRSSRTSNRPVSSRRTEGGRAEHSSRTSAETRHTGSGRSTVQEPVRQTKRRPQNEDPEVKRRRKKKKKIKRMIRATVILGAFFLIIALIIFGLFSLFSGSKGAVRRAYAKTISSYQKRTDIAQTILGRDALKWMQKGDTSQSFSLKVTDNTAGAAGLGISGSLDKNTSTKTAAAQIAVNYNDLTAAQFKMYTDNKKIMFSSPGIYDDWLSMDCENIVSQLANSALGADLEVSSDREFSLKMFKDENSEGEIVLSLTEEMMQVFNKEIDRLSKKAEYTKTSEKKAVMIDGAEKRLRGYKITIDGNDFKNALVNVLSKVRSNKKIKALLSEQAKMQYESNALYRAMLGSPEALLDEYYKEMDLTLEEINASSFIDTNAEVYIYKGVIADMQFNTVYNIDNDQMKVTLTGGMNGGSRPYEDVNLVITLESDNRKLSASYVENTDNFDNTFVNKRSFVLDGDSKLELDTSITFDKSTGVLNGSADLKTPSGGFVNINGSGNLTKENGITKITSNEIKLDYNNALTLVMAGSYEIKAFKKRAEEPQGNVIELFKADAAQVEQIKATIAQNIDTAIDTLNKALDSVDGITSVSPENAEGTTETTTGEGTEETTAETTDGTEGTDNDKDNEDGDNSENAA